MSLRLIAIFVSFILASPCFAQPLPKPPLPPLPSNNGIDEPSNEQTRPPEVIVEPTSRFSSRIIFLYDCSASMNRHKLNRALNALMMISEQPIDEMQIAIIAFDDEISRWIGIPELTAADPIPEGWAGLPSADAISQMTNWLSTVKYGGMTNIFRPLTLAIRENREEISIVIISDGQFNDIIPSPPLEGENQEEHRIRYILSLIETEQRRREENGLDRVQINAYGLGPIQSILSSVCRETGGAYIRESLRD